MTAEVVYTPPHVRDHGTLVDLTRQFDLTFVGSVAKVVTMAAVSSPMGGGGGGVAPGKASGAPGINEVLGQTETPHGGGALTNPGGGAGHGLGSGGGSGGARGAGGGGGGGNLPFTGFAVMFTAGIGMILAGIGAALRSRLGKEPEAG